MKKYLFNGFLFFALITVNACSNGQDQSTDVELAPSEFSKKMKEFPQAPVIDVRTPEEYKSGHLQNAVNIDWNGEKFDEQLAGLNKANPVLVYCLSGGRSSAAASSMRKMGFKQVYELKGGILKWRKDGFPETTFDQSKKSKGVSLTQFNSLLSTDRYVLINFYATWCTPCKKMEPYLDTLKQDMQNRVEVIRLDAEENKLLFEALKLSAIPTLLLYRQGTLIWQKEGYADKNEVLAHLK